MHVSTSMHITSLSQIPTLILFNTILSLVGYMGHNYAQIGGKITPNFLQCVNTFANALQGAFANV